MSVDALRDALPRAVFARPIIADAIDVLMKRLGGGMSRATVVTAVQEVIAS